MNLEKLKKIVESVTQFTIEEHKPTKHLFIHFAGKYTQLSNVKLAAYLGVSEGSVRYAHRMHLRHSRYSHSYKRLLKEIALHLEMY